MSDLALFAAAVAAVVAALVWRRRVVTTIYPPMVGLLYRDGQYERELPPGRYVRLDPFGRTRVVKVSLAELPTQFSEITVVSKDQFSFRIALAPVLRIVDARLFVESQGGAEAESWANLSTLGRNHPALNSLLPAAALEVVAARTLPEILADQNAVAEGIRARLEQEVAGAAVDRVLLTAINLPPETRRMFTDVERARMEGLAALERARAEQAALRALANAARLVNDNPGLANLRLLQAIESSKGSTTIVLGNPQAPFGAAASAPMPVGSERNGG